MTWRARSASDKTEDWPFWYVTDDRPKDSNKTLDAVGQFLGVRPTGWPFLPRDGALRLAEILNKP